LVKRCRVEKASQDLRNPVERLVERSRIDDTGVGRPLSRRALYSQRSVEAYLEAGVRPRWMERLIEIERRTARERRDLERAWRDLAHECAGDTAAFAARWRAAAARWRFDVVNELIEQHNDWYPIERDLPMDPRTRDYVKIRGRSYRRTPLTAEWVLELFPTVPPPVVVRGGAHTAC
jgi:hypothetical protein